MAKKDANRVSINKFESAINPENTLLLTLTGTEDVVFHVKKNISLSDMTSFVSDVVESCVDGENGEYIPEAYNFAIRVAVLTYYGNFTMPSNLDKQYELIYRTTAFDQIINVIDKCQFDHIIKAIDDKIQFMINIMSSAAVAKINEIIYKFDDITASANAAFAGVSADDINKVMRGVSKLDSVSEKDVAKIILENQSAKDELDVVPE